MEIRAMTVIFKSHRFFNTWQNFKQKNLGFTYYYFNNLKSNSQSFIYSQKRYTAVANLKLPELDVTKLLKHLFNPGENTQLQGILKHKLIHELIQKRTNIVKDIENLTELGKSNEDEELKKLAEEEKHITKDELILIDNNIIDLILEYLGQDDHKDIIFEMNAGAGGVESMLFIEDLLGMYLKHLAYLEYDYEIIELDKSSSAGIRSVSLTISGKDCFKKLRHEGGIHRVQRIPATEKSGRIHTSVISVAVLPQPNEIEVIINPSDVKIDTMKASGAGGQHVNTTNSAVRITHLPTGIQVECQTQKSQIKNRSIAMMKLRTQLYHKQSQAKQKNIDSMRKSQKGKGERNEKIRTYNFNQDRITDHRLTDGTLHNLKSFMAGGKILDDFHIKLQKEFEYKLLLEILDSI